MNGGGEQAPRPASATTTNARLAGSGTVLVVRINHAWEPVLLPPLVRSAAKYASVPRADQRVGDEVIVLRPLVLVNVNSRSP